MKKLKIVALLGLMICTTAGIASCGGRDLAAPTGLIADEENQLTWTAVENAYSYKISITSVADGSNLTYAKRDAAFSLSDLEEGDYQIQVMAVAKGARYDDSEWSAVYPFHKNYETGCVYTLINNTEYEITKATSKVASTVIIEDFYKDKPVTRIAENAFKGSGKVEKVVLGSNIVSIGDNAFYNCKKLETVDFASAPVTEIGESAFQGCTMLKSIEIPEKVTVVSDNTFSYCRSLETAILHSKITSIGASAFADCSALKVIDIPASVTEIGEYAFSGNFKQAQGESPATGLKTVTIGKGVKSIGDYAFFMCGLLDSVTFAKEGMLESIGKYAFSECDELKSLALPAGVVSIGYACFYKDVKLESINIPDSVLSIGAFAFNNTKLYENSQEANGGYVYADKWLIGVSDEIRATIKTIGVNGFKSGTIGIADEVFSYSTALTEVSLPQSVKSIGTYAFYGCTELIKVQTYDNSLEVVGERAFEKCTKLQRLLLGEGLKTIGAYAFYNCQMLNGNNLIPSTVTSVGAYAFKNTDIWKKQSGVVYVGKWVVGYNSENLSTATLPAESVVGIADYAFYNCETLHAIYGLDQVSNVGRAAFYGCKNLAAVTLNRNLREIKEYTFYKCSALFSVEMPRSVATIGRSAFYKCEQLDKVDLSDCRWLASIGDYAFYGCFNVKELKLSEAVETIGQYAFYKNTSIKELVIPESVETIGKSAFSRNTGLETLTLETGVETIGDYAFSNCAALKKVVLPDSVKTVGNYAFYKCSAVEEFSLGTGVEAVGDYAFYNFNLITQISLPQSLKQVGRYAFKGFNLTSIVLLETMETLGDHALYGSKNLTVYTDAENGTLVSWSEKWNSSYRPVVWGCTLSEDKSYVVSVAVTAETVENAEAKGGLTAPERAGYTFAGWDTDSAATAVVYTAAELVNVPKDTTVYAVWIPVMDAPEA